MTSCGVRRSQEAAETIHWPKSGKGHQRKVPKVVWRQVRGCEGGKVGRWKGGRRTARGLQGCWEQSAVAQEARGSIDDAQPRPIGLSWSNRYTNDCKTRGRRGKKEKIVQEKKGGQILENEIYCYLTRKAPSSGKPDGRKNPTAYH